MKNTKKNYSSKRNFSIPRLSLFLGVMLALAPLVNAEDSVAGHGHGQNLAAHELNLNHGKKWGADSHTMNFATQMNVLLEKFEERREEKTLHGFQALGGELQKTMDQLIQGCTMTGPPHNQLHIWLSGISPVILKLKDANSIAQAKEAYDQLKPSLNDFTKYFALLN